MSDSNDQLDRDIELVMDSFEFGLNQLGEPYAGEAKAAFATLLRLARLGAAVEAMPNRAALEHYEYETGKWVASYDPYQFWKPPFERECGEYVDGDTAIDALNKLFANERAQRLRAEQEIHDKQT